MPKDEQEAPDPLLAIASSGSIDHDIARVIIGTHSPTIQEEAAKRFDDDMGGPPHPGAWKRRRSS